MKADSRLHALKILSSLLQNKQSLTQLMPPSAQVLPKTKELCFGFCRHFFRLQSIADVLMDKRPKVLEVWVALLMGLYQLEYMHQPDYAVVKETVALLEKTKNTWAKAFVNAVLRKFCRQHEDILVGLKSNPSFAYGQPPWLLQRLQNDWPQDWQAIAAANDLHPPMTLRVNQRKTSASDYLRCLEQAGKQAWCHDFAKEALCLDRPCDVQELPDFAQGAVSVQDAAAQLAVSLLDLKPGLRVLDACSAPGGKTGHILETEPELAACLALDVDARRLKRVQANLDRLQCSARFIQGDACNPQAWWDNCLFDRILLDAPCSATGVIRRHSDIKLLRSEEDIHSLVALQGRMLKALWPLLAPGGLLVYATCSVLAEENEQQIAGFARNQLDCQVLNSEYPWGRATGHGQQILPGEQGMDGFFYALCRKRPKS